LNSSSDWKFGTFIVSFTVKSTSTNAGNVNAGNVNAGNVNAEKVNAENVKRTLDLLVFLAI